MSFLGPEMYGPPSSPNGTMAPPPLPQQAANAYNGALSATDQALGNAFNPPTVNPYTANFQGYNATGYQPAQMSGGYGYNPYTANAPQIGTSYNYNPATVNAQGYQATTGQAASLGPAAQYAYQPGQFQASTYSAAIQADPNKIHQGMGEYYNPYTQQVVDTTMSQVERNRQLALDQNAAQAAAAGAFGGSRHGVVEAETNRNYGDIAAQTSAGLYNQMFNTAAGLSGQDVGNQINVNTSNQNARNQAGQFNAAAQNQLTALDAQLAAQSGMFNAGQSNNVDMANAGFAQNMNLANMGALNQAGQFNSGLNMQGQLANQGAQNAASQFGLGSQLAARQTNAGLGAQVGMFNAGAGNNAAQFGQGLDFGANQFNAGAMNSAGQFNAGAMNQAGQFNANAFNSNDQFNAGQLNAGQALNGQFQQNAVNQQLSGAGQLGALGQTGFNNAATIAGQQNAAGNQIQNIDQGIIDNAQAMWEGFSQADKDALSQILAAIEGNQSKTVNNSNTPSIMEILTGGAAAIT